MRELTCIVCPIGCSLEVDGGSQDNPAITGNRCQRGAVYALEEIRAPKRVVTATVPVTSLQGAPNAGYSRVPVKTSSPCLREKIPALLRDIYGAKVSLPVKIGDVIIADWNGEGIDVIATRTLE